LEKSTLYGTLDAVAPEILPRHCSIAAALTVLGEKWSLLVVRELALGVTRFDDIQRHTGAPRDILTSRLRRLEEADVLERRPYQERPLRHSYHLTKSGNELRPILLALSQWGERWTPQVNEVEFVHTCGEVADVVHTCRACGEPVTGLDLRPRFREADAAA
jgi:DNA-binding HxlR family transcriptional regulator